MAAASRAEAKRGLDARRFRGAGPRRRQRRFRLGRLADLQRIDADRLGDVLELSVAEIADLQIEARLDLTIGILGETDGAGLGDAFEPRGDVDAVTHEIAVTLLDYVADVDADAEFDALFRRQAGVALDQAVLHFDGAAHRVDHAAEFDDRAVAGALDDAAAMGGDGRVEQVAAKPSQARQRSVLVDVRKPRVADHVGDQDRRQLPGLTHGASRFAPSRRSLSRASANALRAISLIGLGMAAFPCCTAEHAAAGNAGPGSAIGLAALARLYDSPTKRTT